MYGYCWPTPKYRNWCAQHVCFEGKKVKETSPRKSTPRTLKEVGQQYPYVSLSVVLTFTKPGFLYCARRVVGQQRRNFQRYPAIDIIAARAVNFISPIQPMTSAHPYRKTNDPLASKRDPICTALRRRDAPAWESFMP
jgi:hypothetical protein